MDQKKVRGSSRSDANRSFFLKAINSIVLFKSIFVKPKSETDDDEKKRMALAYQFFNLEHSAANKNTYCDIRKFVFSRLEKELCSNCKMSRLIVFHPNMFLLPDCAHIVCCACMYKADDVSFLIFLIFN
jgi:hypothetical protein